MSNIAYHFNEVTKGEAVTLEFREDLIEDNSLKGKIALRVLEGLKRQKVLDLVVYTSDNGERINLI